MKQLKLPNGSYVHPGEVERVRIEKHFWRRRYFVQMCLHDGQAIHLCAGVSEPEAREVRRHYEQQLEGLAADVSAYKEGRTTGLARGEKTGYSKGHRDGYNEGFAAASCEAQQQAFRAGIDTVLEQLKLRQFDFNDEMRYRAHLIAARKQSLVAMNDSIESIVAMFTPQPQATTEQGDTEVT